jgi:hypothetical protein
MLLDYLNIYTSNKYIIVYLFYVLSIFVVTLGKLFFDLVITKNKELSNYNIYLSFVPIVGLFFLGNILVVFNFFINLNSLFVMIFLLIIFIFGFFKNFKIIKKFYIFYINITILLISSTNIGISKDASLYHLQNQAWIRDEKIVLGLSNLNPYIGYSSIIEYINSLFWMDNNYIFVHLISLIFFGAIFEIVFKLINASSSYINNLGYIFLVIGFFDNFGFDGGRNGFIFIQETFKYDHIFSVISISIILLFFILIKSHDDKSGLNLLLLCIVFGLQTRFIGHLFFVLAIILLVSNNYKLSLKKNIYLISFYVLFSFKNLLISSCLWFPVKYTCLNFLPWYQPYQAEYISKLLMNTNKLPNSSATDIINFNFFIKEFFNLQFSYILNFFLTISFLFIIFIFFSKKINLNYLQIFIFILTILTWFYLAPTYRFGVPFFLASYYVLTYNAALETRFPNILFAKKIIPNLTYFLVIVSILRIDSISELKNFNNIDLRVEEKELIYFEDENGWNRHQANSGNYLCGVYRFCSIVDYSVQSKETLLNYKYFESLEKTYYKEILQK